MKLTKDNLEKCAPKNIQDPLFSFIVFVNGKFTQSDILSERGVLTNGVDYIPIPVYLRSFPDAEFFPASEIKMPNSVDESFAAHIDAEKPKGYDTLMEKYKNYKKSEWGESNSKDETSQWLQDLDYNLAGIGLLVTDPKAQPFIDACKVALDKLGQREAGAKVWFDAMNRKAKFDTRDSNPKGVIQEICKDKEVVAYTGGVTQADFDKIADGFNKVAELGKPILERQVDKIDSFLKTKFGEDYTA